MSLVTTAAGMPALSAGAPILPVGASVAMRSSPSERSEPELCRP